MGAPAMAHVSARPSWLTDDMLAEMRRLRGTSKDNPLGEWVRIPAFERLLYVGDGEGNGCGDGSAWVNAYPNRQSAWLTPSGHAALNAIDLEELSPLNVDGTLKGEIQHVTLSSEIMGELLHPEPKPVCVVTVTKTEAPPPLPEPKNLWDRFNNEAHRRARETSMRLAGYTDMAESDKLVCMQALAQAESRAVARKFDIDPTKIGVTVTTNGMGFFDVKIEIDPMLGLAMKETP